ncbi:MAG TPA: dethiobiotin synthase [Nitrospirota bacterium]|nr:dethiobiotin synthase [Nitrospirota bacterium]
MNGNRALFITGTDTGVGKTYVASGIASAFRRRGFDVGVMKPVETGCPVRAGRLYPRDALRLRAASGSRDKLDLVNPYRFMKPLAPSVAAEFEGKEIDIEHILAAYRELLSRHDRLIIESAGGIMVPITGSFTFLDLAEMISAPVFVVARPGLGTINHTMLTLAALRQRSIEVAGIIINFASSGKRGAAEKTNPAVIQSLCGNTKLEVLAHESKDFSRILEMLA